MKKAYLKLMSFLLAICVTAGMLPVSASAEQTMPGQIVETIAVSDPVYNAPSYITEDAAVELLTEKMQERQETIVVQVCTDTSDYSLVSRRIMEKACMHMDIPTAGDYLHFHRNGYLVNISYYPGDTGPYYYTFTYTIGYYTTKQQEQLLDAAIADLLEELALNGKSDYEKVAGVYHYMTQNITYDYDNLEDEHYNLKYTAYAALMNKTAVCQGYANLFYRLMLELGVDCRIVTGIGNGGDHAWNIVKLDGKYYNVDATWDSQQVQAGREYRYFLRCEESFDDHDRDGEYRTTEFYAEHPMGETDYTPVKYGDADGANGVTSADAALILQYVAGWAVNIDAVAADVDNNGEVTGVDAALILQYVAGWDVNLGAA